MKKAFTWMVLLSCISYLSAQGISSLDQATDSVMISIVNQGAKYSVKSDGLDKRQKITIADASDLEGVKRFGKGVTAVGMFYYRKFATEGGLGTTRSGPKVRGILKIENMINNRGIDVCPPNCPGPVDLTLVLR